MNIIYILDLKPETMIRLIDHVSMHANILPRDFFDISYSDHMHFLSTVSYNSNLKINDKISLIHDAISMFDTSKFLDRVKLIHATERTNESLTYYDIATRLSSTDEVNDLLTLCGKIASISSVTINDNDEPLTFRDVIRESIRLMLISHISLRDSIHIVSVRYARYGGSINF